MKEQTKLLKTILEVVKKENKGNENCYAEYITLHDIEKILSQSIFVLSNIEEPEEKEKKMTREKLREQFEKTYYKDDLSWCDKHGYYNDKNTRLLWRAYKDCCVKNNLLREGE